MICPPCRDGDHLGCPDFTRAGSNHCDCQHKDRESAVKPAA